MNPNRITKEYLPLFMRHNQQFFREADMTMAPMVLDRDQPRRRGEGRVRSIRADGLRRLSRMCLEAAAFIRSRRCGKACRFIELFNDTCNSKDPGEIADIMANVIKARGSKLPGFYFFRTTWISPTQIVAARDCWAASIRN